MKKLHWHSYAYGGIVKGSQELSRIIFDRRNRDLGSSYIVKPSHQDGINRCTVILTEVS